MTLRKMYLNPAASIYFYNIEHPLHPAELFIVTSKILFNSRTRDFYILFQIIK